MDDGTLIQNMDRFGHIINRASDLIIQMGIGTIPTMDGNGYLTLIGDGLLSTMEDGNMILMMDGYGYQVMNGHLPG